jgi:Tol biopolymer transport system component
MLRSVIGIIAFIGVLLSANAEEITFNEGTNFGLSVDQTGTTIAMDIQGVLWTMSTEGGEAKAITSGQQPEVREPSFSPDGSKIAFQGFYQGYFHIWTVNVDGSDLKQITDGQFDDREPFWNADGETITFASDRSGNYDIWDINVNTSAVKQITRHPDDDAHPHKSKDGNRLLFTREIKGRYSEIVLLDDLLEGSYETSLMKSEKVKYYRPNWYSDDIGFSYISHNGNDIMVEFIADINDRNEYRNKTILDQGDIFPFRGTWGEGGLYYTADGIIKFIPFVSEYVRGKRELTKRKIRQIDFTATINSVRPNYVKKQRDFDSLERQSVRGIGSMDISAKNNDMIFSAIGGMWLQKGNAPAENIDTDETGQVNDPTWSNDGSRVAFVAERDGQMDIWVRNMLNGREERLTNDKNREYRLSWSFDGTKIAYLSTRGRSNTWGRADLKIIDTEYGTTETIEETVFTPGRPVWTSDNDHLLMAVVKPATTRFREGMHIIRQYNVRNKRKKDFDMPGNIGLSTRDGSGPAMSPDGKRIAYVSEGEIRVSYVDLSGNITGTMENRCPGVAHMPRWKRNSEDLSYLSGSSLLTCNVRTGEISTEYFNLTWARTSADDVTIHVGKLFNGVSDTTMDNVDVYISKGRITKITPHGSEPAVGELIDHSMDTMIPGIMAGHTHQTELLGEKLGRNWLSYGITSVRDPGSNPYKSLMRKETWESGIQKGPRIFYAGWLTGGARIYYGQSYSAINEKALRHEITRAKELDYDMVKSYVRLPDEFQQILIKEAHAMGIPLSSHEIAPAVQNAMDSVEHMGATSRRGYSPKFSYLSNSYADVTEIIAKSGLFITPTATLETGYFNYMLEHPEYLSDVKYRVFLDELQRDSLRRSAQSDYVANEIRLNSNMLGTIKQMHDKGANFTAGTDSPFIPYGIAQHFEMIMFVDAGLSEADAIRAATIKVAENIGVEKDLGTLEVGKIADMAILEDNPLDDIRAIREVKATIRGGHYYTGFELTTDRSPR